LKTLIISKETGGLANEAHLVENWPGEKSIPGIELMMKFREHVENLGVKILEDEAKEITKEKNLFSVKCEDGSHHAKAMIVALGTERRKLNLPEEKKFTGRGVSYCATCDAAFYKNKIVSVIGGSDAAGTAALMLSQFASKVYIIYRKERLRCEPITCEKISKEKKIELMMNANIKEIKGDAKVTSVVLDNGKEIALDGIFIEIGGVPAVALLQKVGVKTDEENYIIVSKSMETNVSGVFAAGDITNGSNLKQIITAAAQGAIAAYSAFQFIKKGAVFEEH
jgi:thioredoxin reductase (NADPH)